jgi:hypothetical protein
MTASIKTPGSAIEARADIAARLRRVSRLLTGAAARPGGVVICAGYAPTGG